ncbi:hypothetical protein [Mesobacillus zeae]|uniref:Uncharacterized protein n=1 Tax=Mesobacillus zeae TaxID=1917180 RepID=A0A398AYG6_9BACI|nr:hypothetical protein [Mesobacillus zeae]RID82657.1 hypothetical protein D1970_18150 [Mesobacillus zeae]
MDNRGYISREVMQWINEHGDEIEAEILQYPMHYEVIATICQDHPPYKDIIAFGSDPDSKEAALFKAVRDLVLQTYWGGVH